MGKRLEYESDWGILEAAVLGKPRIDHSTKVRDPLFPAKRGTKNPNACVSHNFNRGKCNRKSIMS